MFGHFMDWVIFGLPCLLLMLVVTNAWDFADAAFETPGESYGFVLFGILGGFYEIAFVAVTGQTPGRVIAGVRVRAAKGGVPGWTASVTRCALAPGLLSSYLLNRSLPESVASLVDAVLVAAFIVVVLRDPLRRGWHDKVAGTIVVPDV